MNTCNYIFTKTILVTEFINFLSLKSSRLYGSYIAIYGSYIAIYGSYIAIYDSYIAIYGSYIAI